MNESIDNISVPQQVSTLSVWGCVAAADLHQLARAVLRHGGQPGRYRYSALWVYSTSALWVYSTSALWVYSTSAAWPIQI